MVENRWKRSSRLLVTHVLLVLVCLFFLLPLFWVLRTSLVTKAIAYQIPPQWDAPMTFKNYVEIFINNSFGKYFMNSLIVSLASTFLSVILGAPAAYYLARKRGGTWERIGILASQMLPAVVLVIPIFNILVKAGLKNTHIGLILTYLSFALPYVIWMLIGFVESIPSELDEAAEIDGCTRVQAFAHIIFPIVSPGIVASAVLSFLMSWNEFLFALVLTGEKTRTLPVAVAAMETQQGVMIAELCASVVVVIIPIVILSQFVKKYLVRGLSFGSIK